MTESAAVDPRTIVAEIEAEVRRKHRAGEYPEALLARLRAEFRPDEDREPPEVLALLEAARPLQSDRPIIGQGIVFSKRVVRRLLSWYVNPLAQDQTRFNIAIVRELRAIERRLTRAETVWRPVPPAVAGAQELTMSRVLTAVAALERRPAGLTVVAGAGGDYLAELTRRVPQVHAIEGDVLDWLRTTSGASVGAVLLPGVLARLSPAELLEIMPLSARVIAPHGVLLCDLPDPDHAETPAQPADNDPTMRRLIGFDSVRLLAEGVGLDQVSREPILGGRWYLAAASGKPSR